VAWTFSKICSYVGIESSGSEGSAPTPRVGIVPETPETNRADHPNRRFVRASNFRWQGPGESPGHVRPAGASVPGRGGRNSLHIMNKTPDRCNTIRPASQAPARGGRPGGRGRFVGVGGAEGEGTLRLSYRLKRSGRTRSIENSRSKTGRMEPVATSLLMDFNLPFSIFNPPSSPCSRPGIQTGLATSEAAGTREMARAPTDPFRNVAYRSRRPATIAASVACSPGLRSRKL